jgi:hypothetical protein
MDRGLRRFNCARRGFDVQPWLPNKRLVQRGIPDRPTALGLHLALWGSILAAQHKRK